MKGINTPGQALEMEASHPFSPQGAGYFTLRSRHLLGNGTMVMVPILSHRWGIKPRKDGQYVENNWQTIEEWMKLYGDRLVRTLTVMTGDEDEAQDIAQEVFIKAFQAQAEFQEKSSPYTYLYIIALNMVRSRQRSLKQKPAIVQIQDNELPSHYPSPESLAIRLEAKRRLMHAVRNLSPKLRTIVSLFYISEIPIQEISEILDISEGTVKSRLFRARNHLKRYVVQEEHHGAF